MKVISFRVTTETYNQLEAIATTKAETVSDTARKILAGHFENEKSKSELLNISGLLKKQAEVIAKILEYVDVDYQNSKVFNKQVRESLKIDLPAAPTKQQ